VPPTYGPPFASYQAEIFLRGLAGERPGQPLAWAELAQAAERAADPQGWDCVAGGAGTWDTMRANEAAFRRWRIVPRMLRDVSARDLSVTVLGTECPAPLGLAPVGVQTIVHDDGEQASARAAAAVGLPITVSTMVGRRERLLVV
jgi:isopentenyl diphosphate isomerase/L-lactate dehydrogenase-like FMN-dependent dehydrogenase